MRKSCDGGEKTGGKNGGEKKKRLMEIVTTTSLPAVDHPNADRWNAARSCQKYDFFEDVTWIDKLQKYFFPFYKSSALKTHCSKNVASYYMFNISSSES